MSKYIDAERLNMEWQTLKPFGVTDTMIENLKWIVDRQPTIEVSEDCISREHMKSLGYINKGDFNSVETIREWIDNAPSVVPKARPIEMHLDVTDDVVDRAVEQIRAEGEWIERTDHKLGKCMEYSAECSVCGTLHCHRYQPYKSYCPNCGAKMKG